jgi:hypothetical protein
MLITRPFTNEEVADRLEDMRAHLSIASTTAEHSGLIAEACRRLRGQLPSGADNQNNLIVKIGEALVRYHADHAENHGTEAVGAYDDWCKQFVAHKQAQRSRAAAQTGLSDREEK